MKRSNSRPLLVALLAVGLLHRLRLPFPLHQEDDNRRRQRDRQGEAEPGQLLLRRDSDGASANKALDANSYAMRSVITVIKREGVAARDIQTQQVSINPITNSNGKVTGYNASNSVSVDLHPS